MGAFKQFSDHGFHCVRRTDKFGAGLWTDLVIEQTMMRSIKSLGGLTRGRGMNESVRNLWVATLHSCGEIEQTMRTVTETNRQTSEQHVELGVSRSRRDHADLMKVYEWLQQFNPFDTGDNRLRSLTSGLAAKDGDGINCDRAEVVGRSLQENLDKLSMDEAKVKRCRICCH